MIFSSVIYLYRGEDIVTDKMFNDIIDSIINNATDDEIEIIREKLNNHIINHVYDGEVHKELSDEFDSSSCPHCGHDLDGLVDFFIDQHPEMNFKNYRDGDTLCI